MPVPWILWVGKVTLRSTFFVGITCTATVRLKPAGNTSLQRWDLWDSIVTFQHCQVTSPKKVGRWLQILGTKISPTQGTFEDDFPFTKDMLVPWRVVLGRRSNVQKTTLQFYNVLTSRLWILWGYLGWSLYYTLNSWKESKSAPKMKLHYKIWQ